MKLPRQQHQQEVKAFLTRHLGGARWKFALPHGHGNETYLARSGERACFVKLGAQLARYLAMASLGVTPPVLAEGTLADGTSILVQPFVEGRNPSRKDYRTYLDQFAAIIDRMHHGPAVQAALLPRRSDLYSQAALEWLDNIRQRWGRYRALVPESAEFVDKSLTTLEQQAEILQGAGLVASHNDICNANWLVTPDGRLFLVDLESMSLDDPAVDIGATLWWYYPPALRGRFLKIAGYAQDEAFLFRMRVRMAMHCLHILLPREQSFDAFDPTSFAQELTDFRAALAGEENPQGYED